MVSPIVARRNRLLVPNEPDLGAQPKAPDNCHIGTQGVHNHNVLSRSFRGGRPNGILFQTQLPTPEHL
jgi:hypothetical protein